MRAFSALKKSGLVTLSSAIGGAPVAGKNSAHAITGVSAASWVTGMG